MSNEPITITDSATPYLEYLARTKPDWMRKAMKSMGYMMSKAIKEGIKSGAPGGKKYASFMPPAMRAQLEAAFGAKVRRAYRQGGKADREGWTYKSRDELIAGGVKAGTVGYTPLGKMYRAVGYQYDAKSESVKVGWLSNSAKKLGEQIEKGYTKEITENMRKKLYAHGFQLAKGKTTFVIKPRETFGPMRVVLQPKLVPFLEKKIGEYALGNTSWGSSNRVYKVR